MRSLFRTDRGEFRKVSDAEGANRVAVCSREVKLSGTKDPVRPNLWKVNRHRRGKPYHAVNLSGLRQRAHMMFDVRPEHLTRHNS